ncbi:MAG: preprotein translocase subunit YajC [Acidobacteria bacterium]|nr:preprotein translocase subunit YajC [Acidobacteriota bacterium]
MPFPVLGATSAESSGSPMTLIFLLVILVLYLTWFRPNRKKMMAERARLSLFEIGDEVQTTTGMVGTAVREADGLITVRTRSGVELEFVRRAILGRYVAPTQEPSDEGGSEQDR